MSALTEEQEKAFEKWRNPLLLEHEIFEQRVIWQAAIADERERIVRELRDHLSHCRIDEPTNYDIYWAKGFAAALDIVKGETP